MGSSDDVKTAPDDKRKHSDVEQMEEMKPKKGFPGSVFFILGNEFCERYCYYGMRTILVLYLRYYLMWDDNTATAVYHAFTVLAYLFPLLGAMIADSWWGKYNTILWLSIVYAIGMVIITLGAVGDLGDLTVHAILSSVGLAVIAFGTGGIKPCVSAFGGDQFSPEQDEYRSRFFSLFYLAINGGSLVSTFVSPLIREQVQCFGGDCYALAFGIPAVLMIFAIVLFIFGTKYYIRYPPAGNIFIKACATVGLAIKNRWNTPKKQRNKENWMDYADDGTNLIMIRDIKYVINVLIIFIPLPLFWALFDQQGSRWTLQAIRMDGYIGSLHLLPDQMQICNPLMIVTLIPLFEVTLYPCLRKFNINFSPLRRMTAGMLLACLSFIVAALVQLMIDENLTSLPYNDQQVSFRIINSADCDLTLGTNLYPDYDVDLENGGSGSPPLLTGGITETAEDFVSPGTYAITYGCSSDNVYTAGINLVGMQTAELIISNGLEDNTLKHLFTTYRTDKSDNGDALVNVVNTLNYNVTVDGQSIASNTKYDYSGQERGTYMLSVQAGENAYEYPYEVKTGALYTLVLRESSSSSEPIIMDDYMDVHYNDVNLFWMIPQYFIITLGEVFLSVTGLEFAYSQAPPSMKSVLTSFWLFTVSLGNIIVLIVAEARLIPSQADEYFLFAGLIGVAAILFIFLAVRYKYVDETEFDDDGEDHDKSRVGSDAETSLTKDDLGKVNEAFDHNTML